MVRASRAGRRVELRRAVASAGQPGDASALFRPDRLNSDYLGATAHARLDEGVADAIAFGRPFIANPDLVERLRSHADLNAPVPATFYSHGAEGYTDYPALTERQPA